MYNISQNKAMKIDVKTFSELNMVENDVEELLRCNIDMICDEEESMLIVGKQVRNASHGISDLTAIDNNGNIVLIEINRDRKDMESRKEAFEFQAIRYAASYATIEDIDDLVTKIYSPYIEKFQSELGQSSLTSTEIGLRKVNEFLDKTGSEMSFNKKQRVILVASDFDEQTLSAVAWLSSNGVDMSCFKLIPYQINNQLYIDIKKVLPLSIYSDYYVDFLQKNTLIRTSGKNNNRRSLPKIDTMLEWGVVKPGDIIIAKGRDDEGILKANGYVDVNGEELSMQKWLKDLLGWSSIQTYVFAIHKESNKSLAQIRGDYMNRKEIEED